MADAHARTRSESDLGTASLVLGIAGLLPIPGFPAAVAATICGWVARSREDRSGRATAGLWLGVLGVLAPVVLLLIYCVVLGYPFPIHRYHGTS
jgi:hypothetical protein